MGDEQQRKLYMQAWRVLNKERLNAERRRKYSEDPEYQERIRARNRQQWDRNADAINARRRKRRLRSEIAHYENHSSMLPLPWDADLSQERALAELEGRDPSEAVEAWGRAERSYQYHTFPQSAMVQGWDSRVPEEARVVPEDVLKCPYCGYDGPALQAHVQKHISDGDSLQLTKFLEWMGVAFSEKARQDLADVKVKLFR